MVARLVAFLTIIALGTSPVLAKPTVIAELGTAPLLGVSTSTAQMRQRVARNQSVLSAAGSKLGLSSAEYAQFLAAIDSSRVRWVTVPRHLDAMTWRGGSRVYVIHDVIIPAKTHGWEVDLPEGSHVLALYMPALCGNLSLIRKAIPVVAHRPTPRPPVVMAARALNPPPLAPVAPPPPPATMAVAVAPPPAPQPTPAAVAESEFPPAPAVTHRINFLPLLLGLAALAGGASSASSTPLSNTPPVFACP